MHQNVERPEVEIDRLSRHQLETLKRLANSHSKTFAAVSGTANDRHPNVINEMFNEALMLIQWGLAADASSWPKYQDLMNEYKEQGRDCIILVLNGRGQLMFGRQKHDKWVN